MSREELLEMIYDTKVIFPRINIADNYQGFELRTVLRIERDSIYYLTPVTMNFIRQDGNKADIKTVMYFIHSVYITQQAFIIPFQHELEGNSCYAVKDEYQEPEYIRVNVNDRTTITKKE